MSANNNGYLTYTCLEQGSGESREVTAASRENAAECMVDLLFSDDMYLEGTAFEIHVCHENAWTHHRVIVHVEVTYNAMAGTASEAPTGETGAPASTAEKYAEVSSELRAEFIRRGLHMAAKHTGMRLDLRNVLRQAGSDMKSMADLLNSAEEHPRTGDLVISIPLGGVDVEDLTESAQGYAHLLSEQLIEHLELLRDHYTNPAILDEFLQLYCLDASRPAASKAAVDT